MPEVGDSATRTRAVRDRDIELFTELTGDRNPLHYDDELASSSRFEGRIVQGGVTVLDGTALVWTEPLGP